MKKKLIGGLLILIFLAVALSGCTWLYPEPIASFTVTPANGVAPLKVSFDASGSEASGGTITAYNWNFGDGTSGEGKRITHTYQTAGNFTVSLTITAEWSFGVKKTDRIEKIVVVAKNKKPYASFTVTPSSGVAPLAVNCNASASYDQDGTIESYDWQFGDGTIGQGITVSHLYSNPGAYTITLTVTDDKGAHTSTTQQVMVFRPLRRPVARVRATLLKRWPTWTVRFDGTGSYDPDGGPIVSYQWDIAGMGFTTPIVTIDFWAPGTYPVSLTVIDDDGQSSTTSGTVGISSALPQNKALTLIWKK